VGVEVEEDGDRLEVATADIDELERVVLILLVLMISLLSVTELR
jgi:hypothetical protein